MCGRDPENFFDRLLGLFAGLLMRDKSRPPEQKLRWLVVGGAACLALGWLWGLEFPVIKRIWTSSFVLVAGGSSFLLLGLFYWLIDLRGWKAWTPPFTWIGMNAITAYLAVDRHRLDDPHAEPHD